MTVDAIYKQYHKPLVKYAQKIVVTQENAEDIVANVFEKILHNAAHYEQLENLQAYLYKMVRNHCINFLNKHQIITTGIKEIYDDYFSEQQPDINKDLYEIKQLVLKKIVEELTIKERALFYHIFIDELNVEEICKLHNIKAATIRSQKRYILNRLKVLFSKYKWLQ